ncbi:MAG: hypothetical protein JGK24_15965 [Microcoleus sp. PH2017_29_MFU_D_A]|jgi:hypothetical protein|uniref:hypothetical protein n=1 Tax=unclassified Microcoleus TaxID=2642155 RepID=UPI001D89F8F7|nr:MULTISPECIES: hypothetical protein [unclassified Microcoleus]MCC3420102.1 hypothetical protein [Microcoleus sp. PH2017_07_MST_O_A]MCC3444172.1 hypothetical protein [Microcoleus sp. PH2017_03_ELD_O_A]MCC3467080.1 hypothetical protein [Microcoleus sp. PH2017_06_SFM_O_A]MCC3503458.1 hypothetical protein [Microcoleus sp. PH2017_19_SFW_U_A]MCC3510004.1 hypothetical protein [Microcoleus sp. PH2017_17_BER_D_A]TAE12011.1 MAG: hypothetical protein EAZ94_14020 [Oscillatoriales cyanobacterium]
MLKSVKGIYRDGKVVLLETPGDLTEGKVIVTFLAESGLVELQSLGIDRQQAGDLRVRLSRFAEDWERPEMDAYDAL